MKKWYMWLVTSLLIVGLLTACGTDNQEEPQTEEVPTEETEEQTTGSGEAAAFPITITDATGSEIVIEEEPQTLISLVPSNTEIVYALEAFDRVVAVTDNDDFPEEVKDIDTIGGMEFNVEKIIAANPDLVLANEMNNAEGLDQIRNAGVQVLVVNNASSFAQLYDSIEMVGNAVGKLEEANNVITSMQDRINEIQTKASEIEEADQATVWVEIWPAPDMYTTGKGTFMHEMLEMINATNAAGDQEGWPMFTEEDAVVLNPDVIITTYGHVEGMENAVEDVLARTAWTEVEAVKNERVYNIEANIVERPGPRLIEGVEKLAKLIYPDVFEN
ncbi:ABC transporter substrate-binding protein [Alkalihalobacterium chitinilyticum]|uniref:ABC transporter substrate-binding protein n=1 Tax=Alkalihalobacterium chitinilyticum TaxID=2980103 RepID=A0ABT5V954_9BACI|nr:ABC transporter substrate-binding protein [Alkalihalobacterium chitinilyticum]MDE5411998.1 ABC transporter substrate-binding protein [Alkalihalobacterium chitinilyticum]